MRLKLFKLLSLGLSFSMMAPMLVYAAPVQKQTVTEEAAEDIDDYDYDAEVTMEEAAEDIPEPYAVDMDLTRAIKGQFTDFFPDENFAEIVAKHLKKSKEDRVTLFELQEINKLYINYQNNYWSVDASIRDFLAQTPFVEQIDLEGIGYLMGLEELYIKDVDDIIFPDDLTNCYRLNRFSLMNSAATIPLELLEIPLQHLVIGGHGYDSYGKLAEVPLEFIQKYENGELTIRHETHTGKQEVLQIQTGESIDLSLEIPPVLISLLENFNSPTKAIYLDGWNYHFSYQGDTSVETFLNQVSREMATRFNQPGIHEIVVAFTGYIDSYYTIPVVVTKAPLTKEININTTTYNGMYQLNVFGEISGDFVEGSNILTPEQIESQNITLAVDGYDITFKPHLYSITVAVSNDRIISVTVVGEFDTYLFIGVD